MNLESLLDLFRDASGKILILLGLLGILIGVLFTSQLGSWVTALGLLLGVFFLIVGFVVNFDLFRVKFWSREGFGLLFICMAPLLLTSAVISVTFAKPDWAHAYLLPTYRMGFARDGEVIVVAPLVRLYSWLAGPLAIAGVCLFVFGVLLKVYDDIF